MSKCHYCGGEANTVDHVIPKSRGGTDDPSNLVPACKSCNSSKGAKLLSEWRGRLPWRIEVYSNARGKLYWRSRKGSGRYKPTIPVGPLPQPTMTHSAAQITISDEQPA